MRRGKGSAETGAVVVEAALTLLFFFTLLLGIMEGGRFLNVQQTVTNAAREGARMAVAPITQTSTLPSDGEIETEVRRFLDAARISGATITVERPLVIPSNGLPMQYTRVRVSVPYRVISLAMFSTQGGLSVNLAGEALMRNETSP
jgi:Flp pilus assembly protein TadG